MSLFNEAKLETLHTVDDYVELSPSELADLAGISLHCASNRLRRCYKQGLLDRDWDPPSFNYAITENGLKRIEYLESVSFQKIAEAAQLNRCKVEKTDNTNNIDLKEPDEDESEYPDDFDEDDEQDQNYFEDVDLEQSLVDAAQFAANNKCRVKRE